MSTEPQAPQEQVQGTEPQVQEAPQQQHNSRPEDISEIFSDNFSEMDIANLFDEQEKQQETATNEESSVVDEKSSAPETLQEEAPKQEQEQNQHDDSYKLNVQGQDIEVNGDQLTQLVDFGIQFKQNEKRFKELERYQNVVKNIEADPQLMKLITDYKQGKMPQQQEMPDLNKQYNTQDEAIKAIFQHLKPYIAQYNQEQYGDFVNNVNNFARQQTLRQEFDKFQRKSNYTEVNNAIYEAVRQNVANGSCSYQQATMIEKELSSNPQEYAKWYSAFEKKLTEAKQAPVQQKTVKAPKLTSSSVNTVDTTTKKQISNRAVNGDLSAISEMFDF